MFLLTTFVGLTQNTFIPDDNFEQALIDLGYDTGPLDDNVLTANIQSIKNLDLNLMNISNLTGIEDFRDLLILDCSRNELTNINISSNSNLKELLCHDNQLTFIDITKNTNLEVLWCYKNLISDIDVTQNSNLVSLVCWENNLTSLNISNNSEIVVLGCEINRITNLDLSNNPKLNRFQCWGNLLTELDVSNNPDLTYLDCSENQLTSLNLSNNSVLRTFICANNDLEELNLTQNSNVINFDCSNNNLCSLNIKNGNNNNITFMDFSNNPNLNCIAVDDSDADHSLWTPTSFTNYVNSINNCGNTIPIDMLEDFVGRNYTLPVLNNGSYYLESGGEGLQLNAGDFITTNQTIYIYNKSGCFSNETSFSVTITKPPFGIPKYFTPNNDGTNDMWRIIDQSNDINTISIYDRYGKLIKYLPKNSQGWDGTFNGQFLPNDSYWYEIILNDREVIRGVFALKR